MTRKYIQLPIAIAALTAFALSAEAARAQPFLDLSEEANFTSQMGAKKHQKRQKRPIKLGTSGGNINDFTISLPFISCCSGTLGGLIEKNGEYFILSNNHVLARINAGEAGDPINQPGMLDNLCQTPADDFVAELTGYKKLKLNGKKNKVDAAIARIDAGDVELDGEILRIGVPGNTTVDPKVGMLVQKSGRTSGHTEGVITIVNISGDVGFPAECSEDAELLTIFFIKQFIVEPTGKKDFSAPGDSGSLILENVKQCPRVVGLLFAGGGNQTVANKASTVIKQAKKMKPKGKASFVGCDPVTASSAPLTVERGIPELGDRQVRLAERIQQRHERRLLDLPGVHAMGIGRSSSEPGKAAFKVMVEDAGKADLGAIPERIDGVAVEVVESPRMRALSCPSPAMLAAARGD